MKLIPQEIKIMNRMKPGVITLSGFLGTDNRHVHEIIEDDEQILTQSGRTAEEIADRMEYFTQQSFEAYAGSVIIDDKYEVESEVTRGKLPCPFSHKGIYRKTFTTLANLGTGHTIRWTALNIHLIREHHFFEGKGSAFRLEPDLLVKILF